MATTKNKNLFYQLYSKSNDVTNSGYVCSSAVDEKDTSFDISNSEALITDSNGNVLSSLDLSSVHVDELTQYNTETRILLPHSAYILHGNEYGETYKQQFFLIEKYLISKDEYLNYCNLLFDILYDNTTNVHINTYNIRTTYGSFIELAQSQLNKLKLPVSIIIREFDDPYSSSSKLLYICFQSTKLGYDFIVRNVILTPIKQDDETYNNMGGEFTDSPFMSVNIMTNDILTLLDTYKPTYIDSEETEKYNINCDIFRSLLNISFDINNNFKLFNEELKILNNYFKNCFDENGNIIDEELLNQYIILYNNIYEKYFNNILIKYNFNDILNILNHIQQLILGRIQLTGPYMCLEDLNKLILNVKYPNGAMRGIVIVPDWSTFDSESEKRVLLINHIADKIEIAVPVNDEKLKEYFEIDNIKHHNFKLFEKAIASVNINALIPNEKIRYINDINNLPLNDISSNDGIKPSFDRFQQAGFDTLNFVDNDFHREPLWINNLNNNPYIKFKDTHAYLSYKVIGLYRYMEYLTHNDLWLRVGDIYAISGINDDFSNNTKNLLLSVLIYNPNDIPVRIKYIIFS